MKDVLKCYEILELAPGATAEQVRKAYIELAHVWHPDRFVSNPVLRARAQHKMQEIDEAYRAIRRFLPDLQKQDAAQGAMDDPEKLLPPGTGLVPDKTPSTRYLLLALVMGVLLLMCIAALALLLRSRAISLH